ncbi:hypothetical protein [Micromonospora globispora]|uniref:hypothetical protein n=1 Tax=Micromonospora globispora TaxID=1450148 RepID=UPI000F5FF5C4|nr:hypothetical protein [Micromonospora globispora]
MREEIIPRNVAKLVRAQRPAKQEREPLTVQQVRTLLNSTRDHRLADRAIAQAVTNAVKAERKKAKRPAAGSSDKAKGKKEGKKRG